MEMGIPVHPKTYQDKNIENNPDFDSMELQNYIYTVTEPDYLDLDPVQPWAALEFVERTCGHQENPGKAWLTRQDVWMEFLECPKDCYEIPVDCPDPCGKKIREGSFAYTYGDRMFFQLYAIIKELKNNPDSRQLYLGIWDPEIDIHRLGGVSRVPCSLGYLFQARQGKLHMTYMMRSSDFATHFQNDVYLAYRLLDWMAQEVGMPVGRFTHYIGSLHIFRKDGEGVF